VFDPKQNFNLRRFSSFKTLAINIQRDMPTVCTLACLRMLHSLRFELLDPLSPYAFISWSLTFEAASGMMPWAFGPFFVTHRAFPHVKRRNS
jgi:hypothetical protein